MIMRGLVLWDLVRGQSPCPKVRPGSLASEGAEQFVGTRTHGRRGLVRFRRGDSGKPLLAEFGHKKFGNQL